jgi:hypothetical protein
MNFSLQLNELLPLFNQFQSNTNSGSDDERVATSSTSMIGHLRTRVLSGLGLEEDDDDNDDELPQHDPDDDSVEEEHDYLERQSGKDSSSSSLAASLGGGDRGGAISPKKRIQAFSLSSLSSSSLATSSLLMSSNPFDEFLDHLKSINSSLASCVNNLPFLKASLSSSSSSSASSSSTNQQPGSASKKGSVAAAATRKDRRRERREKDAFKQQLLSSQTLDPSSSGRGSGSGGRDGGGGTSSRNKKRKNYYGDNNNDNRGVNSGNSSNNEGNRNHPSSNLPLPPAPSVTAVPPLPPAAVTPFSDATQEGKVLTVIGTKAIVENSSESFLVFLCLLLFKLSSKKSASSSLPVVDDVGLQLGSILATIFEPPALPDHIGGSVATPVLLGVDTSAAAVSPTLSMVPNPFEGFLSTTENKRLRSKSMTTNSSEQNPSIRGYGDFTTFLTRGGGGNVGGGGLFSLGGGDRESRDRDDTSSQLSGGRSAIGGYSERRGFSATSDAGSTIGSTFADLGGGTVGGGGSSIAPDNMSIVEGSVEHEGERDSEMNDDDMLAHAMALSMGENMPSTAKLQQSSDLFGEGSTVKSEEGGNAGVGRGEGKETLSFLSTKEFIDYSISTLIDGTSDPLSLSAPFCNKDFWLTLYYNNASSAAASTASASSFSTPDISTAEGRKEVDSLPSLVPIRHVIISLLIILSQSINKSTNELFEGINASSASSSVSSDPIFFAGGIDLKIPASFETLCLLEYLLSSLLNMLANHYEEVRNTSSGVVVDLRNWFFHLYFLFWALYRVTDLISKVILSLSSATSSFASAGSASMMASGVASSAASAAISALATSALGDIDIISAILTGKISSSGNNSYHSNNNSNAGVATNHSGIISIVGKIKHHLEEMVGLGFFRTSFSSSSSMSAASISHLEGKSIGSNAAAASSLTFLSNSPCEAFTSVFYTENQSNGLILVPFSSSSGEEGMDSFSTTAATGKREGNFLLNTKFSPSNLLHQIKLLSIQCLTYTLKLTVTDPLARLEMITALLTRNNNKANSSHHHHHGSMLISETELSSWIDSSIQSSMQHSSSSPSSSLVTSGKGGLLSMNQYSQQHASFLSSITFHTCYENYFLSRCCYEILSTDFHLYHSISSRFSFGRSFSSSSSSAASTSLLLPFSSADNSGDYHEKVAVVAFNKRRTIILQNLMRILLEKLSLSSFLAREQEKEENSREKRYLSGTTLLLQSLQCHLYDLYSYEIEHNAVQQWSSSSSSGSSAYSASGKHSSSGTGGAVSAASSLPLHLEFNTKKCHTSLLLSSSNKHVVHIGPKIWSSVVSHRGFLPNSGIYEWIVRIDNCNKGHVFIGIATSEFSCEKDSYLGIDRYSWGLIGTRSLWHNKGKVVSDFGNGFGTNSVIIVTYDSNTSSLSYRSSDNEWGVAFENLPKTIMYPALSLHEKGDSLSFVSCCLKGAGKAGIKGNGTSSIDLAEKASGGGGMGSGKEHEKVCDWTSFFLEYCHSLCLSCDKMVMKLLDHHNGKSNKKNELAAVQLHPLLGVLLPSLLGFLTSSSFLGNNSYQLPLISTILPYLLPMIKRCKRLFELSASLSTSSSNSSSLSPFSKIDGKWQCVLHGSSSSLSTESFKLKLNSYSVDERALFSKENQENTSVFKFNEDEDRFINGEMIKGGNGKDASVTISLVEGYQQQNSFKLYEKSSSKSVLVSSMTVRSSLDGNYLYGKLIDCKSGRVQRIEGIRLSSSAANPSHSLTSSYIASVNKLFYLVLLSSSSLSNLLISSHISSISSFLLQQDPSFSSSTSGGASPESGETDRKNQQPVQVVPPAVLMDTSPTSNNNRISNMIDPADEGTLEGRMGGTRGSISSQDESNSDIMMVDYKEDYDDHLLSAADPDNDPEEIIEEHEEYYEEVDEDAMMREGGELEEEEDDDEEEDESDDDDEDDVGDDRVDRVGRRERAVLASDGGANNLTQHAMQVDERGGNDGNNSSQHTNGHQNGNHNGTGGKEDNYAFLSNELFSGGLKMNEMNQSKLMNSLIALLHSNSGRKGLNDFFDPFEWQQQQQQQQQHPTSGGRSEGISPIPTSEASSYNDYFSYWMRTCLPSLEAVSSSSSSSSSMKGEGGGVGKLSSVAFTASASASSSSSSSIPSLEVFLDNLIHNKGNTTVLDDYLLLHLGHQSSAILKLGGPIMNTTRKAVLSAFLRHTGIYSIAFNLYNDLIHNRRQVNDRPPQILIDLWRAVLR